jgi:hypothetical protein
MRSFRSLLSYTVPCGRMKKLHAPVGVLPSGLLASLRLLVRGLLPATTRRTGEEEEGGKKGGRERGGREKEREREKRRKWDRQTGSTRPPRLPSGQGRHYRLFAICDLEGHSVSSHSLPPPKPPSQAGRPGRVLYSCIEISVRAHHERQLPTPVWLYPPAGNILPHAALFPGHLHMHRPGSLRSNRKARSPIFPVLIWTRRELSAF